MKIFKISVLIFGFLSLVLLIFTLLLPSEKVIHRNIEINTLAQTPYGIVIDLKQWKNWFPLFELDYNTVFIFGGGKPELPTKMKWISSNQSVAQGKLKIKSRRPYKRIQVLITLQNEKTGILDFAFTENSNSTSLVLEFRSSMTFFEKWMGFVLDSIIGPTLVNSLERIKSISEYVQYKNDRRFND